jgi:tetratricopeptide (TPR) repeat protein
MKEPPRIHQWRHAAWGMAILFASLPLASWLFLGGWGFPGASELAFLCAALGAYLEVRRRRWKALRDDAIALERALTLASEGETGRAAAVLTNTIRISPKLWQAYQYRGQLRLSEAEQWEAALSDFDAAIALAPDEAHLYALRSQAHRLLGEESAAQRDEETALALKRTPNPGM